jgi:hypothetical protein
MGGVAGARPVLASGPGGGPPCLEFTCRRNPVPATGAAAILFRRPARELELDRSQGGHSSSFPRRLLRMFRDL